MLFRSSGGRQGVRFLFALPLLLVLLAAASRYRPAPAPGSDKAYHFFGFVVNAITLEPISGATVTENVSKMTATTDQAGYFDIELPANGQALVMIKGAITKPGFTPGKMNLVMAFDQPKSTIKGVGLVPVGQDVHGFSGAYLATDDDTGLLQKDPGVVHKAYDELVAALQEQQKIKKAIELSPHIYYEIDGKSYAAGAHGQYAGMEILAGIVIVNGKVKMTGDEVNQRYVRQLVTGVGTMSAEDAKKQFGVDHEVFTVNLADGIPVADTPKP